jgi:DNA invertase Pin-like site-specific DNA recombinase
MKVGVYVRKSRLAKDDESLSIPQQRKDGLRRAKTKFGATKAQVVFFEDKGLSGNLYPTLWKEKRSKAKTRPGLSDLLEAVDNGEITHVICRARDRLARNLLLSLRIYKFLNDHQVKLDCTHEELPCDPNDATGMFSLAVLAAAAQLVLDQATTNIRAAKTLAKEEGLKMGPVFAIGFKDGNRRGTIERDEKTIPIVKEIFKRYAKGHTLQSIVTWAKETHPHAHSKIGKTWHHSTIKRTLTNIHYIGKALNIDGVPVDSKLWQPAVISEKLFYKVQDRLASEKGMRNRPDRMERHLLSGILKCANCKNEHGEPQNLIAYSRFSKKRKDGTPAKKVGVEYKCYRCKGSTSPFIMRESVWMEFIETFIGSAEPIVAATDKSQLPKLQHDLRQLDAKLEILASDLADGGLDNNAYNIAAKVINKAKQSIDNEIYDLESASDVADCDWVTWDDLSFEDKRIQLTRKIKSIEVFKKKAIVHGRFDIEFPLMQRRIDGQHMPKAQSCLVRMKYSANITKDMFHEDSPFVKTGKMRWFKGVWDEKLFFYADTALNATVENPFAPAKAVTRSKKTKK